MTSARKLEVRFYKSESGSEPVREWLKEFSGEDKRAIGKDLMIVEMGWPIGMPVCRPLAGTNGLWEVRSSLSDGRIARILFSISDGWMVLLHGFVKKTQRTPPNEINIALQRRRSLIR
ncbi:type II toxin-antitoxin system RelE/ParE family toxin [soil metagenome]